MASRPAHTSSPFLDPVELARGALASLSFVSSRSARDVHVTQLVAKFKSAGMSHMLESALLTLGLIGEAEKLEGGYWIPCPTRLVPLDDTLSMLVGITPTEELQHHFLGVTRAGAGRVLPSTSNSGLPKQALDSWMGADGLSYKRWTETRIGFAIPAIRQSILLEDTEVFGLSKPARGREGGDPLWLAPADTSACTLQGVQLYRARNGETSHRYFLGKLVGGSLFFEGPSELESFRLQYGLAALAQSPLKVPVRYSNDCAYFRLPLRVPKPVWRLLLALCEEDRMERRNSWICRNMICWNAIMLSLLSLGCRITENDK